MSLTRAGWWKENQGSVRHKDVVFEKCLFKCQKDSTCSLDLSWKGIASKSGIEQPQQSGGRRC